MATRVLQILSDFVRWRWAPFVGLLGASLFYVLFAILLIPSQVGASETEEEETPGIEAPEPGSERGDEGTESDTHTSAPSPVKHIDRSSPAQAPPAPKRRGFSPPLERPEPAPPTPPPPPPPAVAEQVPAPPQAPPPPDPAAAAAAEEQQRLGAAAAARAATLAATRASRLSGRGLRPRLAAEVPPAAEAPVHEESEVAADNEEESDAPESNANAEQGDAAGDDESDDSDGEEAAEAEPQEAEDE